ncbi:lysine--tRNA ligase [Candidatus Pacearchaeota archaeon]|nr:lysine--tRNA ligase [Candidatus Pacearchaeota archaeon]
MSREKQIINERKRKITELRELRVEPYPHKFDKKQNVVECLKKLGSSVKTAGRLMTKRELGRISFASLQDFSGGMQIVLQEGGTSTKVRKFFKKYVDTGDFVGISGKVIKTKTGEVSILVKKLELLSKAIKPLPEKFHGLKDKEERYRKRYLDLIMNSEVRKIFETRAIILEVMREFMKKKKFVEVETPLLQTIYGGALAKPFKTHCDAYNSDVYLSIAPELFLKKAQVGGFENVYEITKKFRNEGVDRQHNPEHMTIEWYQAYADYNDGMDLFEELIKTIAKKLFGKLIFKYQGHKINLAKWRRVPILKAIKENLNEDISRVKSDAEAKKIAKKHGIEPTGITKTILADELMKLFRHKLIQPTFLIDYPIELAPLAKPNKKDPTKAEVFQPFVGGMELGRAYSELNDPGLQAKHFKEQEEERKKGNVEAMGTDKNFVAALEHGMPPACGVGVGIERVIMLFTNQPSIRDVIMFPFMKPEK